MRVVLAAITVFAPTALLVRSLARHYRGDAWPDWAGPLVLGIFCVSIFVSLYVFNRRSVHGCSRGVMIADSFRVFLAALFVFTPTLALVGYYGSKYPRDDWPQWAGYSIIGVLFVSAFASLFLFNKRGFRPSLSRKNLLDQIADLRREGLLLEQTFTARRAFQVQESEDEGLSYFIELNDATVLFLTGQYLYEFEPTDDDPELNQPRRFPCTAFTVLRHKEALYVIDILCSGVVLEPEMIAPPFDREDWRRGIPEDGARLSDRSYDEIKRDIAVR